MDDEPRTMLAPEWRCIRCQAVFPSPDGSGRPPNACLTDLGGCSRTVEGDEEGRNTTHFFPSTWSAAQTELYVRVEMDPGQVLFRDIVREIERYFIFQSPIHSRLAALFVLQSYLVRPVLPCVFYLGVSGPPSAGKTTLLEILKDLSWNGVMSGDVKVPALSRMLHVGCTLFADEADVMDEDQRDLVYGSARRGYRRGSTRIVSVQRGKNWEPEMINIFGAYAFSFYSEIDVDPALLSRMVKFEVARLKTDVTAERVYLNMARVILGQSGLKERTQAFAEEQLKTWSPERTAHHLLEKPFQDRVAASMHVTDLPRDIEIVAVMTLVADICGIDIQAETKALFEAGGRNIEEGALDDLEAIRDIFGSAIDEASRKGKDARMRSEDVRHEWNLRRKQYGDRAETAPEFKRRLGRLGFRAGTELIHPKNRPYVVWTPHLEAKLTGEPSPTGTTDLTQFLGSPNPSTTTLTRVSSQQDKVRVLRELGLGRMKEKEASGQPMGTALTPDEFWDAVKQVDGFTPEDVTSILKHWLDRGEVYQPRDGLYRFS